MRALPARSVAPGLRAYQRPAAAQRLASHPVPRTCAEDGGGRTVRECARATGTGISGASAVTKVDRAATDQAEAVPIGAASRMLSNPLLRTPLARRPAWLVV